MKPIYSLRDIVVPQGERFSLSIDALDILPGRLYALVGPNGAGKSTLLRLLALLEPPGKGFLHFAGAPVCWRGPELLKKRRQVTLVHQSPYLFSGTVGYNLAFGLRLRGIGGEEAHRRIAETLQDVGLRGFEAARANDLSGGESQRVALARALVLNPRVLLLDEAAAGLDTGSLLAFERIIASLPRQGMTVVLATHDPAQPARIGGKVLRLEGGRMVHPVSPSDRDHRLQDKVIWLRPLKTREQ